MDFVSTDLRLSNAPVRVTASHGTTTKALEGDSNVLLDLNLSTHKFDSHLSLDLKLSKEGLVSGSKDNQADGNKQSNDPDRVFPCKFCYTKFTTSHALAGHQRAHKRESDHIKRPQGFNFDPIGYSRFHPYSNRPYYGYAKPSHGVKLESKFQKPSRLLMPSTVLPYSYINRSRIESFDTLSHMNEFGKNTFNSIANIGASSSSNPTAYTSNGTVCSSIHKARNEGFNAASHTNGFGANRTNSFLNYGDNLGQADRVTSDEVDPSGIDLSLKL